MTLRRGLLLVTVLAWLTGWGALDARGQSGFGGGGDLIFPSERNEIGRALFVGFRTIPEDYPVGFYASLGILDAPGADVGGTDLDERYATVGLTVSLYRLGEARRREGFTVYGLGGLHSLLKSRNYGVEGGIGVVYPFGDWFNVHAEVGSVLGRVGTGDAAEARAFPFLRTVVTIQL